MSDAVHFDYPYAPAARLWHGTKAIGTLTRILADGDELYRRMLVDMTRFRSCFEAIAAGPPEDPTRPFWANDWFPVLDGMSLYMFLVERNPRWYVEVGSGNSTKFARQAIRDHGLATKIVSIDPTPRAEVDALCDRVMRSPLEEIDISFFETLDASDIVFIDSSHRSFQNSDVTVFFMEILPCLPRGMLFGLHDIFLPHDYPDIWSDRWYNEQYLLAAYVFGGAGGGSVHLPGWYVSKCAKFDRELGRLWDGALYDAAARQGAAFWLTR